MYFVWWRPRQPGSLGPCGVLVPSNFLDIWAPGQLAQLGKPTNDEQQKAI